MDVAALTSRLPTSSVSASKLADDFDNFLKLLTTQLANQDPLEPLDSNEFTAQLVRFTQVEQAIGQNQKLEQLVGLIQTNQSVAAVNYIGKRIEADSDEAELVSGEKAEWTFDLPQESAQTTLLVRNATGTIVYADVNGAKGAGKHTFQWDGKDGHGNPQAPGVYKISILAKDSQGSEMVVDTNTVGTATGVETVAGTTMIAIGKVKVAFDKVQAISQG